MWKRPLPFSHDLIDIYMIVIISCYFYYLSIKLLTYYNTNNRLNWIDFNNIILKWVIKWKEIYIKIFMYYFLVTWSNIEHFDPDKSRYMKIHAKIYPIYYIKCVTVKDISDAKN